MRNVRNFHPLIKVKVVLKIFCCEHQMHPVSHHQIPPFFPCRKLVYTNNSCPDWVGASSFILPELREVRKLHESLCSPGGSRAARLCGRCCRRAVCMGRRCVAGHGQQLSRGWGAGVLPVSRACSHPPPCMTSFSPVAYLKSFVKLY